MRGFLGGKLKATDPVKRFVRKLIKLRSSNTYVSSANVNCSLKLYHHSGWKVYHKCSTSPVTKELEATKEWWHWTTNKRWYYGNTGIRPLAVLLAKKLPISSVILSDQIKNLDWKTGKIKYICTVPEKYYQEAINKVLILIK